MFRAWLAGAAAAMWRWHGHRLVGPAEAYRLRRCAESPHSRHRDYPSTTPSWCGRDDCARRRSRRGRGHCAAGGLNAVQITSRHAPAMRSLDRRLNGAPCELLNAVLYRPATARQLAL